MPSDSGGTSKVSRFASIFTGCFGRKKRHADQNKTSKTRRYIELPRRFLKANILKHNREEKPKDLFIQELHKEKLLANGSTSSDYPIINICLGFQNEELQHSGPKIFHKSYANSRWDRVLSGRKCREGIRELTEATVNCNEPIVDDLPASIWMECLEPTLAVLIALRIMKHRRTNLTMCRTNGRSVNATMRDSRIRHGDFNFNPWHDMIGPFPLINLTETVRRLTEEVRPSRLIDLTGSPLSVEYDIELNSHNIRKNQQRTILTRPAQNPYNIEDDEPMAYTFPDGDSDSDYSLSDSSVDENVNQSASTNQEGSYAEIKLSNRTMATNLNVNHNSSNNLKMRTYLWRETLGRHMHSEPEEITTEDAHAMQSQWLRYLNSVKEGNPTTEDADILHSRLKDDPWSRRRFFKDAVLFLEDLDTQDSQKRKQKRQELFEEESFTDCSSESNASIESILTLDSVSNISSDLASVALEPPPPAPPKLQQLMADDYVICNVIPRSFELHSGTSVESLDSTESDPFESIKSICQSENTDNKPKGVVLFTGKYVTPNTQKSAPKRKSTDVDTDESTSVLSVYTRRSLEDVT